MKANSVDNRVNKISENKVTSKMQTASTPDSVNSFNSLEPEKGRQLIEDTDAKVQMLYANANLYALKKRASQSSRGQQN